VRYCGLEEPPVTRFVTACIVSATTECWERATEQRSTAQMQCNKSVAGVGWWGVLDIDDIGTDSPNETDLMATTRSFTEQSINVVHGPLPPFLDLSPNHALHRTHQHPKRTAHRIIAIHAPKPLFYSDRIPIIHRKKCRNQSSAPLPRRIDP